MGALVVAVLLSLASCGAPADYDSGYTVVIPRPPESLDPRFTTDPYGIKVTRLIHRSLFTVDPFRLEVVGDLAESHRFESPTRLRIQLVRDAHFSDGSVLDASDVKATLDGLANDAVDSVYAGTFRRIAEVEVLGPYELVITLTAPHATILTDLEVPILRAEDAYRARLLAPESFVGAGPFRLREWDGPTLRLERVYGDGPASVRLIVLRDENGRALRLLSGKADAALNAIPQVLLPMFEKDERFTVDTAAGIGTSYLGFRLDEGLFSDPRMRRAVAHAVDVDAIVNGTLGGRAQPASSWVPNGHWADLALPRPRFDPTHARALIRDAGAAGRRVVLRTSSDRQRVSICEAIASMLRAVGLDVEVRPSESASLIADLNAGRFELTYLQVPEVFEPHVLHWFFASERVPDGVPGANRWRLRDSQLDAALERGRASQRHDERVRAYATVQRRLAEALPVLPLWQEANVAVFRRGAESRVPRDGRLRGLLQRP
ncbi:MAG: ABC transporter substrate-binding protein [Myxococcota bacterium]